MKISKGQFFIVTTFIIVTILFTISKWLEPASITEASEVASAEESFILNNIAEKAEETAITSNSCDDLNFNLQEFKRLAESYLSQKGKLSLQYQLTSPCKLPNGIEIPAVVLFNISLISSRAQLSSNFFTTWQPS